MLWSGNLPRPLNPILSSRQGWGLVFLRTGLSPGKPTLEVGTTIPTVTAITGKNTRFGFPADTYDGSTSYIKTAEYSSVDLSTNAPFFMSCWFQPSSANPFPNTADGGYLITKGYNGTNEAFRLAVVGGTNTSALVAGAYDGTAGGFHGATTSTFNWPGGLAMHLFGGYDGATWWAGYNGVIRASTTSANGTNNNNEPVGVGAFLNSGTASRFCGAGCLWDARIYNYFPDATTILEMYTKPWALYMAEQQIRGLFGFAVASGGKFPWPFLRGITVH